jgi:hypothetical protein
MPTKAQIQDVARRALESGDEEVANLAMDEIEAGNYDDAPNALGLKSIGKVTTNLPRSAANFIGDTISGGIQTVTHPIDTAKAVGGQVGNQIGSFANQVKEVYTPGDMRLNPNAELGKTKTKHLIPTKFDMANLQRKFEEDPAALAAELSMIPGLPVARWMGQLGRNVARKTISPVAELTTGANRNAFKTAERVGYENNILPLTPDTPDAAAFKKNMDDPIDSPLFERMFGSRQQATANALRTNPDLARRSNMRRADDQLTSTVEGAGTELSTWLPKKGARTIANVPLSAAAGYLTGSIPVGGAAAIAQSPKALGKLAYTSGKMAKIFEKSTSAPSMALQVGLANVPDNTVQDRQAENAIGQAVEVIAKESTAKTIGARYGNQPPQKIVVIKGTDMPQSPKPGDEVRLSDGTIARFSGTSWVDRATGRGIQ